MLQIFGQEDLLLVRAPPPPKSLQHCMSAADAQRPHSTRLLTTCMHHRCPDTKEKRDHCAFRGERERGQKGEGGGGTGLLLIHAEIFAP